MLPAAKVSGQLGHDELRDLLGIASAIDVNINVPMVMMVRITAADGPSPWSYADIPNVAGISPASFVLSRRLGFDGAAVGSVKPLVSEPTSIDISRGLIPACVLDDAPERAEIHAAPFQLDLLARPKCSGPWCCVSACSRLIRSGFDYHREAIVDTLDGMPGARIDDGTDEGLPLDADVSSALVAEWARLAQ